MNPYYDIHIHTTLSKCCGDKNQRPANIIKEAEKAGLEAVGFSDHLWVNHSLKPNGFYDGMHENQITELKKELENIESKIDILIGCEADTIAPGKFSVTANFAEKLDYVLLSCNHTHISDLIAQPENDSPRGIAEHLIEMFLSGANSGFTTSIAHAFVPMGFPDMFDSAAESVSDNEFLDIFAEAAQNNVAIEITLSFFPGKDENGKSLWSLETPIRILSLAKQSGCKFTFGSDSHSVGRISKLPMLTAFTEPLDLQRCDMLSLDEILKK